MIIDQLENASQYYGLGTRIEMALRYLQETDLQNVGVDRYDIDGDKVYAMVQGFWESHRKYLDVQYVAAGAEHMGYAPTVRLSPGEYQEENDFIELAGDGEFFQLREGFFCILAPQDAHMPGMAVDQPTPVKKVVIKVLL